MSEREKFYISLRYYAHDTGDTTKAAEVVAQWKRAYPRDSVPYDYQGIIYSNLGQYEQAVAEHREEVALSPTSAFAYTNLAYAYVYMDRLEEARAVVAQAFEKKVDKSDTHFLLYQIAFLQGDADGMRRVLEWAKGRPDESLFRWAEARALLREAGCGRPARATPRRWPWPSVPGSRSRRRESCRTRRSPPPCGRGREGPRECEGALATSRGGFIRWARPMPSPWPASRTRHDRFSRKWRGNSPSRP